MYLYKMLYTCLFVVWIIGVVSARKRCRKACEKEVDMLKKRVEVLEEKLELLLAQSRGEPIGPLLTGGLDKVNRGPPGPKGEKGDRGERGHTGLPGRQGPPGSIELPNCSSKQCLTADGERLFCMKNDKSNTGEEDDKKIIDGGLTTERQPGSPLPNNEDVKMTRFMRKYMIQSLYADTWDLNSFTFNGMTFLGMSRLSAQTFSMYRLHRGGSFFLKTTLSIPNTRKWTSFVWEGNCYVVIACNDNARADQQAYSYVYKLVQDKLFEFQKLPTRKAFGVTTTEADGKMYIVFAYMYGKTSDVFRWEHTRFVKYSSIPVRGSDIQAFKIGERTFLAAVGTTTDKKSVYLLEYKNDDFRTYGNIDVDSRGFGIKHIQVNNDHYLAVARIDKSSSLILKWNGMTFEHFQSIDSCNARDFTTIRTTVGRRELTYIAVISYTCKPVIYVFDTEKRKQFVKLQETESMWTRDMQFIQIANKDDVFLAVATKRVTSVYAGSTS